MAKTNQPPENSGAVHGIGDGEGQFAVLPTVWRGLHQRRIRRGGELNFLRHVGRGGAHRWRRGPGDKGVAGSSKGTSKLQSGAATMKMISSTSITAMKRVMLMPAV
jgi:hypothetical protein